MWWCRVCACVHVCLVVVSAMDHPCQRSQFVHQELFAFFEKGPPAFCHLTRVTA